MGGGAGRRGTGGRGDAAAGRRKQSSLLRKEATRGKATLRVLSQTSLGELGRARLGEVGNRATPWISREEARIRAHLVIILASV